MKHNGVRTQHPEYSAMATRWQKCRDAAEGESAIHAAGVRYLPKLAKETEPDYKARLNRTTFFNTTWRTVAGLRGMMFRKPPRIDTPAGLAKVVENVDGAGCGAEEFAFCIAGEVLEVGRVGVMIDYPQIEQPAGMVRGAVEALGLRPVAKLYKAETIINWRVKTIRNKEVLTLVVLAEMDSSAATEFGHESAPRYRVLDLFNGVYRQRVFKINERGEDEQVGGDMFPLQNDAPMKEIPFVFVGAEGMTPCVEAPPLIDLVDMSLKHYQVTADYEHGCHFSGLVTLFISGFSPQMDDSGKVSEIYIGGPTANCLPDPGARAYFVETSSNFAALRQNLEDKKSQMAVLGARMLEQQARGVETAEAVAQHRKGEESLLASFAESLGDAMERILSLMAAWAGIDGAEIEVEINKDFMPGRIGAQELTALVASWQAGAISREVLFQNLVDGEIIDQNTTAEEEQARIGNAAPVLPA